MSPTPSCTSPRSRTGTRRWRTGEYRWSTLGRTLEEEGFIHCSTPEQVPGVLARYYASYADDLLLLTVDPGAADRTAAVGRREHGYGRAVPPRLRPDHPGCRDAHPGAPPTPRRARAPRVRPVATGTSTTSRAGAAAGHQLPPNPYLVEEVSDLTPGTALEAGCGEGAEAIWLGRAGWQVTAVDIAAEPLARAAERAAAEGVDDRVEWVRADLGSWEPAQAYDLVTTHYAHPVDAAARVLRPALGLGRSRRVAARRGSPGSPGTASRRAARPPAPAEASVTATSITERLDPATWDVVTAGEHTRTLDGTGGGHGILQDVVVRAVRRGSAG